MRDAPRPIRDPDGLEAEVCVPNPAAKTGVYPPGTPAPAY
jgi:hypothetical protein